MLSAVGTEYRSVIKGKVNGSFYDSLIIHFNKVAFANLLIFCNKTFAVGAADFLNMTSSDFFAIWVFIDFHSLSYLYFALLNLAISLTLLAAHLLPSKNHFEDVSLSIRFTLASFSGMIRSNFSNTWSRAFIITDLLPMPPIIELS